MKLIVNADDFGLTKGICDGIIKAFNEGIVTSTTAMANMPYFDYAIKLGKKNSELSVGIHFVLTCGKPITNCKTLIDNEGNFLKLKKFQKNIEKMDLEEIEKELRAQFNKFQMTGLIPTHIDSHHHVHTIPSVLEIVKKIALEYEIPIRNPKHFNIDNKMYKADFDFDFFLDNVNLGYFKNIINNYKCVEIMCHPGICDDELKKISSYSKERQEELKLLTSNKLKNIIDENCVELHSFKTI